MRPLKLKLVGLRSYREEQEIDFEGVSLIAIVGDTGSGKSSLLEALTVALYGTSTWDAREIKQLISDGASTMQVSLTFRADDKVWRVERAISRGAYPPARHTLELLDGGERFDKKDAVDARIQKLIGLDYGAFLRSVVLPQGRFAALLQAKPAERAQILKGILRIDKLDQVREQARSATDRMQPVINGLRESRMKLLPDPAQTEMEAEARLKQATTVRDAALLAQKQVEEAKERRRVAADKKARIGALKDRATDGQLGGAAATFARLAERDAELAAQLSDNETALFRERAREEELAEDIKEAEAKGAGPAALTSAKSGLVTLSEELPLLAADAKAIDKDEALFAKETKDLEQVEAMMATFLQAESASAKDLSDKQAEEKRTNDTVRRAERALKDLRTAQKEEAKARSKVEKAQSDLEQATSAIESCATDEKQALAKHDEAEKAARAAMQKHSAHHASAGLQTGDACPVCDRPLPDGWRQPGASEAAGRSSQKKLEKARGDLDKVRDKSASLRSRRELLQEKLTEETAALAERTAHLEEARSALTGLLPSAPLAGDDGEILAGALAAQDSASRALAAAEAEARRTREIVLQAKAGLESEKRRHKDRRDAIKKAKDAFSTRKKRILETVSKLPKDLQPALPKSVKAGEQFDVPPGEIASLLARVEVRRAKIDEVVKQLEDARAQRTALDRERTRLVDQRQKEIVTKQSALDVELATYGERLLRLSEALTGGLPARALSGSEDALPARPEDASLSDLAEWASSFERAAGALLARAQEESIALEAEIKKSEETVYNALSNAGAASETDLLAALATAEGERARALADRDQARAEKPIAASLDDRIGRAQALLGALSEVTRHVADGKLIHHVVHRRQRVLLAVASELLGSMTRERYGFSEDFDVVDRVSGQARGTRTLSGGETFLASLALSLALVELAGRAGGRLEALFLDEGFGSLDAGSLSEALDALTQKAEGGRLVAVISHLRSVAESIDKVLAVRMGPMGSRVSWASTEEREKMLSEDVERGLIS